MRCTFYFAGHFRKRETSENMPYPQKSLLSKATFESKLFCVYQPPLVLTRSSTCRARVASGVQLIRQDAVGSMVLDLCSSSGSRNIFCNHGWYLRQKPVGGSKAGGLPTFPFPLSLPSPFPFPPTFSDKPVRGKVRSGEGEVPRLPLQIPPCL